MLTKSVSAIGVAVILSGAMLCGAKEGGTEERWGFLRDAPRKSTYGFRVLGESKCTFGLLKQVKDEEIKVKVHEGPLVTIKRGDLSRIEDASGPTDIIYSGGSSWADVKALARVSPVNKESLRVRVKSGQVYEGTIDNISETELTLKMAAKGESVVLQKENVAVVDYIRVKPVSDGAAYELRESVFIRPELWAYRLGIPPKMTVRVYDASVPEQQTPNKCDWPY